MNMEHHNKFPVLITAFNRPNLFKMVLQKTLDCGIEKVSISIDGARIDNESDIENQKKIDSIIKELMAQYPEVEINVNKFEENQGCQKAVFGALKWFFQDNDAGVILEDDCVPNFAFFSFMNKMLMDYRDVHRVGMICGYNPVPKIRYRFAYPYIFSTFGEVWGWGTWKTVVDGFHIETMLESPGRLREEIVRTKEVSRIEKNYRLWTLELINRRYVDSWAYLWNTHMLLSGKFALIPRDNFIRNMGIGLEATHTKKEADRSDQPINSNEDLRYFPSYVAPDRKYAKVALRLRERFYGQYYIFSNRYLGGFIWYLRMVLCKK